MSTSFFENFTKNHMDASWAYRLIIAIPVTVALFGYLWWRMVQVSFRQPEENPTISVEEAYLDALVNDEMVSSDDEPDSPRRSKRLLNKDGEKKQL